jgi:hypothetical protein
MPNPEKMFSTVEHREGKDVQTFGILHDSVSNSSHQQQTAPDPSSSPPPIPKKKERARENVSNHKISSLLDLQHLTTELQPATCSSTFSSKNSNKEATILEPASSNSFPSIPKKRSSTKPHLSTSNHKSIQDVPVNQVPTLFPRQSQEQHVFDRNYAITLSESNTEETNSEADGKNADVRDGKNYVRNVIRKFEALTS